MYHHFNLHDILGVPVSLQVNRFANHARILFLAVANRVRIIDLDSNSASLLPFQLKHNIQHIAISYDDKILLAVDTKGQSVLFYLPAKTIIGYFNFKKEVRCAVFGNSSYILSVAFQQGVRIFSVSSTTRSFEPLQSLSKELYLHGPGIQGCSFGGEDRFIFTWGKDLILKINSVFGIPDYAPIEIATHKQKIITAFSTADMQTLTSIDRNGQTYIWKWVDSNVSEQYSRLRNAQRGRKAFLSQQEIKAALGPLATPFQISINFGRYVLHKKYSFGLSGTRINDIALALPFVFLCFKNGAMAVLKQPYQENNPLQTVHFDFQPQSIAVDSTGKWLSLAGKKKQIIYEWKSRAVLHTNILAIKKTAIFTTSGVLAGGDNISLYNLDTGIAVNCISEEQIVAMAVKGTVAVTATAFGTVNAYDLKRSVLFRTMRPDKPNKLTAVEIDGQTQLVFAGGFDPYQIFVWNLRSGHLIMNISGHEAPISTLIFEDSKQILVSGSWDNSLRIHHFANKRLDSEVLTQNSQITALAINPMGDQIACSTMKGEISMWNLQTLQNAGLFSVRLDMHSGRSQYASMTAAKDQSTKFLRCLTYSPQGKFLIGGGKGKYLLIYSVKHRNLVGRISLTQTRDLDNVIPKLNSSVIREGINRQHIQDSSQDSDYEDRKDNALPGSTRKDVTKRSRKQPMQVTSIAISEDKSVILVSSSYGLLVLKQPGKKLFNPRKLSGRPSDIREAIISKDYKTALQITLNLNSAIQKTLKFIPVTEVQWLVSNLDQQQVQSLADQLFKIQLDQLQLKWLTLCLKRGAKGWGNCLKRLEVISQEGRWCLGQVDILQGLGSLKQV